MNITIQDIYDYIHCNVVSDYNDAYVNDLLSIYGINDDDSILLSTKYLFEQVINDYNKKRNNIKRRIIQVLNLRSLNLPEQRSKEWYKLRKKLLTASSLAAALGECHFKSREGLIKDKLDNGETPYKENAITEWGVKYEEIATKFYEKINNLEILEFGLIPHPKFNIFGASPDGICSNNSPEEFIGRMLEIKVPPKRKFTKNVPKHYWYQMQGQLECCDLDECDFFQVKLEEYDSYEDYCKDIFEIDGNVQEGRTALNYPKGTVATYKTGEKLSYEFHPLNLSNEKLSEWVNDHKAKDNFFEAKYWKIERYECTLVKRDKQWWIDVIDKILDFYNDLNKSKTNPEELENLKKRVELSKKRKKRQDPIPINDFDLISDDEN